MKDIFDLIWEFDQIFVKKAKKLIKRKNKVDESSDTLGVQSWKTLDSGWSLNLVYKVKLWVSILYYGKNFL